MTNRSVIGRTSYYVVAGALAIMFLVPLVWTTVASVSPHGATAQQVGYGLGNYRTLVDYDAGLPTYLWNSTFVSVLTVVFTLTLSILGGYAFGRFRFPGRDALFLLIIAILMVPYATLLVPLWVLFGELGLRNSLVGLALVLTLYQLPFAMFMMRISFEAVPRELEESALVDGCGTFGVLRRILLRSVWPGLITVGLFAFLYAWNDFIAPLFMINDSSSLPASARDRDLAAADHGSGRLRCDPGRRRRHGNPLPDPVPGPSAPLRPWIHVGSAEGMSLPVSPRAGRLQSRQLGRTGMAISRVGIGAWAFGGAGWVDTWGAPGRRPLRGRGAGGRRTRSQLARHRTDLRPRSCRGRRRPRASADPGRRATVRVHQGRGHLGSPAPARQAGARRTPGKHQA